MTGIFGFEGEETISKELLESGNQFYREYRGSDR